MLTKSDYIKYLQCKKYLWLNKKRPELLPEEIDDNLKRVFESGYKVEEIAYKLFPTGVNAVIDDAREAKRQTQKLIKDKEPIIFQATLSGAGLFCRADIIRYDPAIDAWDIIEAKSTTDKKDIHIDDLAFQKICLERAGLKVGRIILLHINNEYVKNGDIDPHGFFVDLDLSKEVREKEEETKLEIEEALNVLSMKEEPDLRVLRQCYNPYTCPFIPHCWQDFSDHSIYSIAGALGEKKLELLLDKGIMEVKDIPAELLTSDKLRKHHYAVSDDTVHIEKDNIKKELEKIEYPIYFLDYETYGPAIPIIDGYRPYQRIVFQYSLHIQESPEAELRHYYFLAEDLEDPTRAMSESLRRHIGDKGTVIAWNMGFEKGCNEDMGEREKEYQAFFKDINSRMYDLMSVFKKGFYVHKEFHGSASLKKVLPVLAPELSYGDLNIHEGMTASNNWGDMVMGDMSEEDKKKTYNDLLKYCELDTLAMFEILEKLRGL